MSSDAGPMFKAYLKRRLEPFIRSIVRSVVASHSVFGDANRVRIASTAVVNDTFFNVLSGEVRVDEFAFFGQGVQVVAGTHDYRQFGRERQLAVPDAGSDVHVCEGAWVGSGAILLGPCVIGRHAVVGAGAVVTKDVPPYAVVVGSPAQVIEYVESQAESAQGESVIGDEPSR